MYKHLRTWNFVFHEMYPDFSLDDERKYLLRLITSGFDLPDGYIKISVMASDTHSAARKRDRLLKTLNSVTGKDHFFVPL